MLRDDVFPKDILPRRAIIGSERDTQLRALTANPRGCPIGAQRLCLCDYRSVTNSMDDDAPEAEAQMRQVLGLSDAKRSYRPQMTCSAWHVRPFVPRLLEENVPSGNSCGPSRRSRIRLGARIDQRLCHCCRGL